NVAFTASSCCQSGSVSVTALTTFWCGAHSAGRARQNSAWPTGMLVALVAVWMKATFWKSSAATGAAARTARAIAAATRFAQDVERIAVSLMETTLRTAVCRDRKTAVQFLCEFYRLDSGLVYRVGAPSRLSTSACTASSWCGPWRHCLEPMWMVAARSSPEAG